MTPIEELTSIEDERYITEDGDEFEIELLPGLSDEEISTFVSLLPCKRIPDDIKELLKYAGGFMCNGLDEIRFANFNNFGFEEFFPFSIQLAGDGFGNFWILDISAAGDWGSVFYVCHDPAVIVKHSDSLAQFIAHVGDFCKNGNTSHLDIIHEQTVLKIWDDKNGLITQGAASVSDDLVLKAFAESVAGNSIFADLRDKLNKSGFAWGMVYTKDTKVIRYNTELLWAFENDGRISFQAYP